MMAIPDTPDRHAFVMLGKKTLFLCHLTMFHMENHCYQIVIQASLPEPVMRQYQRERAAHPEATYFLGNLDADRWTVPELQTGKRRSFIADIWRGIPYKPIYDKWPWQDQVPVISSIPVAVERIIYYRHFDFNLDHPKTLSYILFGAGDEAFLTHYQVKEPDFDQVVTLAESPSWLPDEQLQAGVPINIPSLTEPLYCQNPLKSESTCCVQYAGFANKDLTIRIARSEWFCTKIVNCENPCLNDDSCEAGPPAVATSHDSVYENHHAGKR